MPAITPANVQEVIRRLNRRTFLVNPFFLIINCTYQENKGDLLINYKPEGLIIPSQRLENMVNKDVYCFASDIERMIQGRLEIKRRQYDATEYFYVTENFIKLEGGDYKKVRKELHHFTNSYNFEITSTYPKTAVKKFLYVWRDQNIGKNQGWQLETFESEFELTLKSLELLDKLPWANSLYVLVDKNLVGFSIFCPLYDDFWVSVFQKVNHEYSGLNQLLYHEKCKVMAQYKTFSNGDDAGSAALAEHKKKLKPTRIEKTYFVTTGDLKKL